MGQMLCKKTNPFKHSKFIFNTVNSKGEFITLNQFKIFDNDSIKLFFNVISDNEFLKYVHGIRFFIDKKTKSENNMGIKNIYVQLKNSSLKKEFIEYQLDCIKHYVYTRDDNGVPDEIYKLIKQEDKSIVDELDYRLKNKIPVNQ